MLTVVLGAPGSGKTTVAPGLRQALPGWAVIDWDEFMPAVDSLVGRTVSTSPDLWQPYAELVRAVVASLENVNVVVLGVCTPDELSDWPVARWILVDCDDAERRRRLASRPQLIGEALADASEYRSLGLETIDTTKRTVEQVVEELSVLLSTR